jgi:hypothetical protein
MSEHIQDPIIIYRAHDRDWIPVPAMPGTEIKVVAVDEERL